MSLAAALAVAVPCIGATVEIKQALIAPATAPMSTAPVTLPDVWDRQLPPRLGAWRYRVAVPRDALAGERPALLIPRAGNSFEVLIKGQSVLLTGRRTAPYPDYSNEPHLVPLPPALLTADPVVIELDVYGEGRRNAGLSAIVAGEYRELEGEYMRERRRSVEATWAITGSSLLIGVLALLVWLRSRDRAFGLFAISALAWGVRTTFLLAHEPPVAAAVWQYLYFVSLSLYLCPLALFFLEVLEVRANRVKHYVIWYLWLSFPALLVAVLVGRTEIRMIWLLGAILIPLTVFVIALAETIRRPRSVAIVLSIAAGTGMAAAARDWWVIQYSGEYATYTYARFAAPFFFLAQAWILTDRYDKAIKGLARLNNALESRVADREREIARLYAEAREHEREEAAVEERERIMREVHDGVGGRLATAAVIAMRPEVPEEIRDAIQDCLGELRLALDVSSPGGQTLNAALAALRHRIEPGLRAAGFHLGWNVEILSSEERPSDATMLMHVVRVVQEAIANAVKHSGGDRINVAAGFRGPLIEITVSDNGVRSSHSVLKNQPDGNGRGIANMTYRAQTLGGEIHIKYELTGTTVNLTFPEGRISTNDDQTHAQIRI